VVSIGQLEGQLGYSRGAVQRAAVDGRLQRLYRGVYAVGHRNLSLQGECLAAVFAAGDGALLSHYSAAWLWGLRQGSPRPFHVTTPISRRQRLPPPIHRHRARNLTQVDYRLEAEIPVTSVARTLLDQAALNSARRLRRLLKRAEELKLFDLADVEDVIDRNRGHRGAKRLRLAAALYEPVPFTRSEFEARFFDAVIAAGLPSPRVNSTVIGMEIDLYWPEHRFAVELDVYETHGTRESFEEDRLRQENLLLEGIEMTRVTGPRFHRDPKAVLDRLHHFLAGRAPHS
jgi:predicted transcriptional regulator of viral defense system/very-short-patch-repair endonuclease